MAEGILRDMAGDVFEVESAGVAPSTVRPEAIEVMGEIGVDISGHLSKSTDVFANKTFDYVITVCDNARENCPVFPGRAERIHWSFDDPAAMKGSEEERLKAFRAARDQIGEKIEGFVEAQKKKSGVSGNEPR
jgi:arsenate reductase